MKLPPALDNLSKMRYSTVIGIMLTMVLDICLVVVSVFMGTQSGYILLMVGTVAITFLVPWLFGIRNAKWLVVVGVVLFFVLGSVNGPLVVNRLYAQAETEYITPIATNSTLDTATGDYLATGKVTPLQGEDGTSFNFTVLYYSDEALPAGQVNLIFQKHLFYEQFVRQMTPSDPADTNYNDGKEYRYLSTLEDFDHGVFIHQFELNFTGRSVYLPALGQAFLGPMQGTESSQYGFYALIGSVSMFCNIGLLFLIIVLLYWWLMSARERRSRWDTELRADAEAKKGASSEPYVKTEIVKADGKEELFTCTSCGAKVLASHNFCPKCGERFEGVEDEPVKEDKK
jgi:Na+-transporting methylmalonyl-CoA/oxaloacetate decarboxylase gamma subunit